MPAHARRSARSRHTAGDAPDDLLLLAHRRPDVVTQVRSGLLTIRHLALRAPEPDRVVGYTDQPQPFAASAPTCASGRSARGGCGNYAGRTTPCTA